ncbi:MAG: phage portal protein, partial [Candidatus Pacebacteria bacterium]|nr:phage portal protein [Candidatus Paceibacterota bacterium]
DCYTADTHMVILADSVVLKYEVNNHGFVPIIHVPNIIHQEEPWGISDIEGLLDAQVEYNEKNSDMSEVIAQNAYDYIFGKNLNPSEVQSGRVNLIDVGDEAELIADPRRGRSGDLTNDISKRLSDIFKISGLNENIFGGVGVRAITGRALSVLMQTVNNRIKGRQTRWTEKLQEMFKNIFVLMEKYTDGGKELVGEYYKVDIFFPGTLVRNITDEINKFNAKVQSQETTMKNMGVPSPKDEKKLIKRELEDKMLMIEISRNPAMQLQVQQMLQQMVAEEVAGDKPTLREDENQEGDEPASAAGAPQQGSQSLAGAVAQAAQRGGGSVPAGPKEGES